MRTLTTEPLRFFACFFLLLPLGRNALAEQSQEYRPALLGHHRRSLVNLINTESLMKRGQKDALVMFECGVSQLGNAYDSRTYRESPGSEMLKQEVLDRLNQAQFEPAVYRHTHVPVYIQGTVNFFIRDGRPHLRIFLHQEEEDLKAGRDFIAPQFAFIPGNTKFEGFYYPPQARRHAGLAAVKLEVDATGKVQGAHVEYEHPPGMGFGKQTAGPIRDALFIPGFRNGKPVACRFTWTMIFTGPGRQMKTG